MTRSWERAESSEEQSGDLCHNAPASPTQIIGALLCQLTQKEVTIHKIDVALCHIRCSTRRGGTPQSSDTEST
jgi:hypothetical protein